MFYHLLPEDLMESLAESHHSAHVRSKTIIFLQQKALLLACTADLAVSPERVPHWVPSPGPRVYPCRKFHR